MSAQDEDEIDPRRELAGIAQDIYRHIEWLEDAGVRQLSRGLDAQDSESSTPAFRPPQRQQQPPPGITRPAFLGGDKPPQTRQPPAPPPAQPPAPAQPPSPPPMQAREPAPPPAAAPAPRAPQPSGRGTAEERLRVIRADIGRCERCKLCSTRNSIVYGQGSSIAPVMFVGEAPGETEDLSGLPFVGEAGQLLTKMIQGMGFTRDEVYVTTIVKCRPPEDRRVEPDEVAACRPFVEEQIRAVQPKVIVALGATAAHTLLNTTESIVTLRHRWGQWEGIPVMPTFHPSYLIKAPAQKRPAWEDLKLVMERLGMRR